MIWAAVLLGFGFVFSPAFAIGYGAASSHRPFWGCFFAQNAKIPRCLMACGIFQTLQLRWFVIEFVRRFQKPV